MNQTLGGEIESAIEQLPPRLRRILLTHLKDDEQIRWVGRMHKPTVAKDYLVVALFGLVFAALSYLPYFFAISIPMDISYAEPLIRLLLLGPFFFLGYVGSADDHHADHRAHCQLQYRPRPDGSTCDEFLLEV